MMKVLDVLVAVVSCHDYVYVESIWNKTKSSTAVNCSALNLRPSAEKTIASC